MLPLPAFEYHRPRTLAEAIALLDRLGGRARIIAGGTDVLPNMKHGLVEPEHLVSVAYLNELRGIAIDRDRLVVGCGMRLHEVADSLLVRRAAPALAEAAAAVGGPGHRAMGTLGGNICLDTRCRYFNQSHFWRNALGFCLKKDGAVCHVVKGGTKCVAAASNDTAPALFALGAELVLLSPKGERRVSCADFYTADGSSNTVLEPGEIVVRADLPVVSGRRSAFEKLRRRAAIDFPLLAIAARIDWTDAGSLSGASLVVSALGARPRSVRAAGSVGPTTDPAGIARALSDAAWSECKPLPNVDEDTEWRRDMVRVLARRAVERALA